jgi:CBS domain-containing protein
MTLDEQSLGTPVLEDAIDRHPLTVPPETPLAEAIALMSQTRGDRCFLTKNLGSKAPPFAWRLFMGLSACPIRFL